MIFGYPPHCTHTLQGLDVVVFALLKSYWGAEKLSHEYEKGQAVLPSDFVAVWGRAFAHTVTKSHIKATFKKTGLIPFNPTVITTTQMAPSELTTTSNPCGPFPLAHNTPTHTVLTVYQRPSTPTTPLSSNSTPTHTKTLTIDPDQYTPSKCTTSVNTLLAHTSALYLIHPREVTSRS